MDPRRPKSRSFYFQTAEQCLNRTTTARIFAEDRTGAAGTAHEEPTYDRVSLPRVNTHDALTFNTKALHLCPKVTGTATGGGGFYGFSLRSVDPKGGGPKKNLRGAAVCTECREFLPGFKLQGRKFLMIHGPPERQHGGTPYLLSITTRLPA